MSVTKKRADELLGLLKSRFEQNPARHPGFDWAQVQARLDCYPRKLRALDEMEASGG